MGELVIARISAAPISVDSHAAAASGPDCGAVVTFAGIVRDHDHGRAVTELEYVGHPSAEELIQQIGREAADRPGTAAVAVSHRIGVLQIGDVALAVAVAAAHRGAAFDSCEWVVEEVKRRLPVWKRQTFADGTDEWVNCP